VACRTAFRSRLRFLRNVDFDAIMQHSTEMGVEIVMPRYRNPPLGKGGPNYWECWIRDQDGYVVVVASPDGSVGGT